MKNFNTLKNFLDNYDKEIDSTIEDSVALGLDLEKVNKLKV